MAFERKMLAGIIGALAGLGVNIFWLLTGQWALSVYNIDIGDLLYKWSPSPNPVACWLAFGPLLLFIAIGFIASYGLASGVEGKKRGVYNILIILAGFCLWLLILGALSLLHYSISGITAITYGNGLICLVFLFAIIHAYLRNATTSEPPTMSSKKGYVWLGLAVILWFVFIIVWSYAVGQVVLLLLSNHYLVDTSYNLFIHDPAINWIQNGLVVFFLMLSIIISYFIISRDNLKKILRDRSGIYLLVYPLIGFLVWLAFCVVLSVLSININTDVSNSSGMVLVVMLLMVYIDDFGAHILHANQSRPEASPSLAG